MVPGQRTAVLSLPPLRQVSLPQGLCTGQSCSQNTPPSFLNLGNGQSSFPDFGPITPTMSPPTAMTLSISLSCHSLHSPCGYQSCPKGTPHESSQASHCCSPRMAGASGRKRPTLKLKFLEIYPSASGLGHTSQKR